MKEGKIMSNANTNTLKLKKHNFDGLVEANTSKLVKYLRWKGAKTQLSLAVFYSYDKVNCLVINNVNLLNGCYYDNNDYLLYAKYEVPTDLYDKDKVQWAINILTDYQRYIDNIWNEENQMNFLNLIMFLHKTDCITFTPESYLNFLVASLPIENLDKAIISKSGYNYVLHDFLYFANRLVKSPNFSELTKDKELEKFILSNLSVIRKMDSNNLIYKSSAKQKVLSNLLANIPVTDMTEIIQQIAKKDAGITNDTVDKTLKTALKDYDDKNAEL